MTKYANLIPGRGRQRSFVLSYEADRQERIVIDAIIYRARHVDAVVQREVDRLVLELPDLRTFIVCYQPEYESVVHSSLGQVYCYGQRDLHALPYPHKLATVDWSDPNTRPPSESDKENFFRAMEMGHQDLPVLKFYLDHPDFDRYWVIEDDVRCSGPWTDIFTELAQSNADLLMTVVQDYAEAPTWFWWSYLKSGKDEMPLERRTKAFPPFSRLSAACLRAIDDKYRSGWGGHYEVTWPTIARTAGLLIEDIGAQGTYTPAERRGRFYSCTSGNGSLFPGTFGYRPPFHDTGVSEFGKNVMPHAMLWHPVKADAVVGWGGGENTAALNLSLRKPALQSSVSPYSFRSTPAEDAKGGNNGSLAGSHGFHTGTEQDPWWQVDLEDSFQIHRVVIFNRPDQAERLKHFSLLGSRDGSEWKVLFRKTDNHVFGRGGEPYTAELAEEPLARFVRVRLDGHAPLHFRECQVFGVHPNPKIRARMARRNYIAPGRRGRLIESDGLVVFIDDENYDPCIIAALERHDYEQRARELVSQVVMYNDRIIEVGTAIGLATMTAARIAGAENVLTFDANADIMNDARDNFKRNDLESIRSHIGVVRNRQAITDPEETTTFYIHKAFWASRLNASDGDSNIVKKVRVPVFCLENMIETHHANVLICDIEGAEVELLSHADLSRIRTIVVKTHYVKVGETATDEMVRRLVLCGFAPHLGLLDPHLLVMRRRQDAVAANAL